MADKGKDRDKDKEDSPEEPAKEPAARRSSPLSLILAVLVLTVLAAGAGGSFGMLVLPKAPVAAKGKVDAAAHDPGKGLSGGASLKTLAPITTNLAGPKSTWVRLEASLVFDGGLPAEADLMAGRIADDILAFLRTVSLADIEGPSGFQNLREDLNDRARIRSGGKARELVIQTLLIE